MNCGQAPLLLFVFTNGLICRARCGCSCFSIRFHPPRETEPGQLADGLFGRHQSYPRRLGWAEEGKGCVVSPHRILHVRL